MANLIVAFLLITSLSGITGLSLRKVACEHAEMALTCEGGQVLTVLAANYGRTDSHTCGSGPDTNCHSGNTFKIVSDSCNHKERCTVEADNSVFGDPCSGTFKYLEVVYLCSDVKRKVGCEHSTVNLDCGPGETLSVLSANYGRTDGSTCRLGPVLSTYCSSQFALQIVSNSCDEEQSCAVLADNTMFGDPCPGTYKYLDVSYICIDAVKSTACETTWLDLRCGEGRYIAVSGANYGRTENSVCQQGPVLTTNCYRQNSLSILSQRCNGRESCRVQADNSVFGDPCFGTYKYLEVVYECSSERRTTSCEHSTMELDCEEGRVLNVVRANYGRTDGFTCSPNTDVTDCRSQTAMDVLSQRCNLKESCSIQAENSVFGDPCYGTQKYLEVVHECNKVERSVACEDRRMDLACAEGTALGIISANYGRTDDSTCLLGPIQTADCHSDISLNVVAKSCSGKHNCSIEASNYIFGDPCLNTFKYLEVAYTCNRPPQLPRLVRLSRETLEMERSDNAATNSLD